MNIDQKCCFAKLITASDASDERIIHEVTDTSLRIQQQASIKVNALLIEHNISVEEAIE